MGQLRGRLRHLRIRHVGFVLDSQLGFQQLCQPDGVHHRPGTVQMEIGVIEPAAVQNAQLRPAQQAAFQPGGQALQICRLGRLRPLRHRQRIDGASRNIQCRPRPPAAPAAVIDVVQHILGWQIIPKVHTGARIVPARHGIAGPQRGVDVAPGVEGASAVDSVALGTAPLHQAACLGSGKIGKLRDQPG